MRLEIAYKFIGRDKETGHLYVDIIQVTKSREILKIR